MTGRILWVPQPDRVWTVPAGATRRHRCRIEHDGKDHVCVCNCGRDRSGVLRDPATGR